MNVVCITGRFSRDPEIRTKDQFIIANFTLAVENDVKKKNSDGSDNADYFDVVTFGKRAEFIEKWFKKGMKIEVVGRLEQNRYVDKNGDYQSKVRIVANTVKFAESKKASGQNAPTTDTSAPVQTPVDPTQAAKQAANASIDNLLMQVDDIPELPF